jgi:hypothetical protein
MERLKRRMGKGYVYPESHSHTSCEWKKRGTRWYLDADAGSMNNHQEKVIDRVMVLPYSYIEAYDVPALRRHIAKKIFMGVVSLGMTKRQILAALRGKLPPPTVNQDHWTWKAKGLVQVNGNQADDEHEWTADMEFDEGRLQEISVTAE